jgi:hypothetical protein
MPFKKKTTGSLANIGIALGDYGREGLRLKNRLKVHVLQASLF